MQNNTKKIIYIIAWVLVVSVFAVYSLFIASPLNFQKDSIVTISSGTSVEEAGELLKAKHVIRSPFMFSVLVRIIYPSGIIANHYSFSKPQSVLVIAYRLAKGKTDLVPLKVTIPEGSSSFEISNILENTLKDFDSVTFKTLAKSQEGYLFPDTYFFLPGTTPEAVIDTMRKNFDEKIKPLESDIATFGKPMNEVLAMASILEREARQSETRRMVAGILWKRISIGMPLQVDAVFGYIFQKSGYAPTLTDLQTDSLYNTYLHRGLPPTPIGNPGLEAIQDAITPTKNNYLYYLTDKEGKIYYAKTFAEHRLNKLKARN
ncbi:endolytic transglycosylase MltG [Patescibacteria group bacterium]|nr:MAG: endolytic transglycosylase MltG [Patescibacteria group bacterium]